jgi:hypothetical protein
MMEKDSLQSAWNTPRDSESTTVTELKSFLQENRHPVLNKMRRQLLIEVVAFTVLLFVYYDFFDGDRRPVYANLLLVATLLLVIVHNIFGYLSAKRPVHGQDLIHSLQRRVKSLRHYAIVSVVIRVLAVTCILLFFSSTIVFNAARYTILSAILLVFIVQLILLIRLWSGRIRNLRTTITLLRSS